MLVLSRKVGEQLIIGGEVVITVSRIHCGRTTIGIDAPKLCVKLNSGKRFMIE